MQIILPTSFGHFLQNMILRKRSHCLAGTGSAASPGLRSISWQQWSEPWAIPNSMETQHAGKILDSPETQHQEDAHLIPNTKQGTQSQLLLINSRKGSPALTVK